MSLSRRLRSARGFTLVELVVAMTIAAIIGVFVVTLTTTPINAYLDQSGRARQSDAAALITHSLHEDLKRALPNSVSIYSAGTRTVIEMVLVDRVVTYERASILGDSVRGVDFAPIDESQFTVLGYLNPDAGTTYSLGKRLVIGNLGRGVAGRDVYRTTTPGVITPLGTTIQVARNAAAREEAVTLAPHFRFSDPGTSGRLFVISTPVTYICNAAANTRSLRRYSGYALSQNIATSEAAAHLNQAGVQNALLANDVSSCFAGCRSSSAVCDDTLVVRIALNRPSATGGTETLLIHEQFAMDNAP